MHVNLLKLYPYACKLTDITSGCIQTYEAYRVTVTHILKGLQLYSKLYYLDPSKTCSCKFDCYTKSDLTLLQMCSKLNKFGGVYYF